jgi:hypothetical protein
VHLCWQKPSPSLILTNMMIVNISYHLDVRSLVISLVYTQYARTYLTTFCFLHLSKWNHSFLNSKF